MNTYIKSSKILVAVLLAFVLIGCASTGNNNQSHSVWADLERERTARLDLIGSSCSDDLCRVMIAQQMNQGQYRPPQQTAHPAWGIFDRALQLGIPAYMGARQTRDLVKGITGVASTIASIDRADHSVNIGGDQIGGDRIDDRSVIVDDRSISAGGDIVGGDQIDDRSVAIGGDNIGGDRIDDRSVGRDQIGGDQRIGDDVTGSCIGPDCRNYSQGPWDESDNSDNRIIETPPPAPTPPDGG